MSNEITVKLKSSIYEMKQILENKGFNIIRKYQLNDTYYIPQNINMFSMPIREILSYAVLVRDVISDMPIKREGKLTFKIKEYAEDNNTIITQDKVDCEVLDIENAKKFMEAIGYKKIMCIAEYDIVYAKDNFEIAIKDIENGKKLIEVETVEDNEQLDTIEKIINVVEKLEIPIYADNYFVKKAEIELEKILAKSKK